MWHFKSLNEVYIGISILLIWCCRFIQPPKHLSAKLSVRWCHPYTITEYDGESCVLFSHALGLDISDSRWRQHRESAAPPLQPVSLHSEVCTRRRGFLFVQVFFWKYRPVTGGNGELTILGLPAGMKTVRKIAVIVFSLQRRNSKWQTERARAPCCPGGVFFCLVLTQLTVITTTGALSSRPGTRSMISSKYLVSDVYECVRLSCDEEGI